MTQYTQSNSLFMSFCYTFEKIDEKDKNSLFNREEKTQYFESYMYSSVPNRHIGPNKHAGGKILKKILNVQTQIRPCRGDFFLKINKRAGQIPL